MAGIDEVMERLITDAEFRSALARDPGTALAEYDLGREDIEMLASRLDEGDDGERTVEQRTSKSAMLSLLASFAGPGAPSDGGEVFNKSSGSFEIQWEIEEGDVSDVEMDDLTHKVDPGGDAHASELEDGQVTSQQLGATGTDALPDAGDPDAPVVTGQVPNAEHEATHVQQQGGETTSWEIPQGYSDNLLSASEGDVPVDQPDGIAVPGSDLMEPTEAEGEDEIPLMPNPEDLTHKVAPSDGLGTDADQVSGIDPQPFTEADKVSGISPQPFTEAQDVMGDAGLGPESEGEVVGVEPMYKAGGESRMGDAGVDPVPGEQEGIIVDSDEAQPGGDGESQFTIQIGTSDMQNAESVDALEELDALEDDVFEIGDA